MYVQYASIEKKSRELIARTSKKEVLVLFDEERRIGVEVV
jgi:hypothetical protein